MSHIDALSHEEVFTQLLPLLSDRQFIFGALLDSIRYCESIGAHGWSLTSHKHGFRLNVGAVEALTCFFSTLPSEEAGNDEPGIASSLRVLVAGSDCKNLSSEIGDDAIVEMNYKPIAQDHWCYSGTFLVASESKPDQSREIVARQLKVLRNAHQTYLDLACRTSTGKLRQRSNFERSHDESLLEYARKVLEVDLDKGRNQRLELDFDGQVQQARISDQTTRLERLNRAKPFPDRVEILSTSYLRNPDVVAETLLRAKGECEACGMPAPFIKLSNGEPYLEVHHKVQLAHGGEDTIVNAIALCPNCHRKAHYG